MHTITEVSRTLDVSTRMLRYYEQQGLIASCRRPDYAYRVYGEENVNRLRITLVLRRLRVPLKAIDFGNFHEWQWLAQWVDNSPDWEGNGSPEGPENVFGGLEEHLNWVYAAHQGWPEDGLPGKIDLLHPIRRRKPQ